MQRSVITRLSLFLFIGFLTWGIYTLVVFYGIPVHGKVLLSESGWNAVASACDSDAFFCRGVTALIPSFFYAIARFSPFLQYALLCTFLYGCFLAVQKLKGRGVLFHMYMKPWHAYALFIVSLFLLFSSLTSGTLKGVDVRRVIEPHSSVYTGDNPEGLQMLQENFQHLQEKNCLRKIRDINENSGEYIMRSSCVYKFFVTRVLSQVAFLSLIILVSLVSGSSILSLLRFKQVSKKGVLLESVLSGGIGLCAIIVALWTMAVFGILHSVLAWILLCGVLIAGYKHTRRWLHLFFSHSWEVHRPWYSLTLIFGFLLLSYFALNFLTVVRPFPIGWDDLGSYLNRPRLLVSYGSFIYKMSSFQWEYMSSIGYLLYGYNSVFGSTASMIINWFAGLFAVLTIIAFVQNFLGRGTGIIAALMYYTLPLIGHFSFADMKTDNAVFAFQTLAILCLFIYLFSQKKEAKPSWKWLACSGVFCAFAFGTKATAIMVFMTLLAVLAGSLLHWSAFFGTVSFAFVVLLQQRNALSEILDRTGFSSVLDEFLANILLYIFGIIFFGYALLKQRSSFKKTCIAGCIVITSFAAGIAPWIVHNNYKAGNIVPKLLLTAPDTLSPVFDYTGTLPKDSKRIIKVLPEELGIDMKHPACISTAEEEELGRYWGKRTGWGHYLTLPWRSVMNMDSAGYYVTTQPGLLLFPLLLLLPFFWLRQGRWLRWLFAGTIFLVAQWIFLANGVPWYGIGMFLGLSIGLEIFFCKSPDKQNRFLITVLITGSLISCFAMREWQFKQQVNLLEYPMGKASANVMRERTIPQYDDITDIVLERHSSMADRPYLYRVGTFIPYFIPKNLEVIGLTDHQLDSFNCLHQERDNQLTLRRLKALGFNSVIFDTNTATIEHDPNGSLHKKVQMFVDFLNDPTLGLKIVVNDPARGVSYIILP